MAPEVSYEMPDICSTTMGTAPWRVRVGQAAFRDGDSSDAAIVIWNEQGAEGHWGQPVFVLATYTRLLVGEAVMALERSASYPSKWMTPFAAMPVSPDAWRPRVICNTFRPCVTLLQ